MNTLPMKRRSAVVPHTHRKKLVSRPRHKQTLSKQTLSKQTLSKQTLSKQTLSKQTASRRKATPNELLTGNRLLTGDCLPLLARLPSGSVDLTVTSPRYDDLLRYDTPAQLDLSALGKALFRVTQDGGLCALVIGDASRRYAKSLTSFRLAIDWCDHAGWRLFETCLYHRHGIPGP